MKYVREGVHTILDLVKKVSKWIKETETIISMGNRLVIEWEKEHTVELNNNLVGNINGENLNGGGVKVINRNRNERGFSIDNKENLQSLVEGIDNNKNNNSISLSQQSFEEKRLVKEDEESNVNEPTITDGSMPSGVSEKRCSSTVKRNGKMSNDTKLQQKCLPSGHLSR